MNDSLVIRPAVKSDIDLVLQFTRQLAAYENLQHQVEITPAQLERHMFGESPLAYCLLAFWKGTPAGHAVYFYQFSTFSGTPVLYLEDIFVIPEFRRLGIGAALFRELKALAQARGCRRFEWCVLDWNQSSIDFYERSGALPLREWIKFRMEIDQKNQP